MGFFKKLFTYTLLAKDFEYFNIHESHRDIISIRFNIDYENNN